MSRAKQLERLNSRIDQLRQDKDRAQGRLEAAETALKEEWGIDSLEKAKEQLKKLEKQKAKAIKAFDSAYDEFTEKWEDQL